MRTRTRLKKEELKGRVRHIRDLEFCRKCNRQTCMCYSKPQVILHQRSDYGKQIWRIKDHNSRKCDKHCVILENTQQWKTTISSE